MNIHLTYGRHQTFRYRTRDLNLMGRVDGAAHPVARAMCRLNGGPDVPFYVEPIPDEGVDWVSGYKDSPAALRLKDQGDFNVELPVAAAELRPGRNQLEIAVTDAAGVESTERAELDWNPEPLPPLLDLQHLSGFDHIQQVGQVVDGAFELDRAANCVRTRNPVYPDSLLVLGSPHGSQEATYGVRFTGFAGVKWLGPSDFFVGHEDTDPPLGIKPGWSSAGMAALNPRGEARSFIAWGDHAGTPREWVVVTDPPQHFPVAENVPYRVRHQLLFENGVNRVRYRIWPEGEPEPADWLCDENDAAVDPAQTRHRAASFGLFQHSGQPVEWSDLLVRGI